MGDVETRRKKNIRSKNLSDTARMDVAKFGGLTHPCNLSLISRSHPSGGGEVWGHSTHPIRAGPTRHREDRLGAIPREGPR